MYGGCADYVGQNGLFRLHIIAQLASVEDGNS